MSQVHTVLRPGLHQREQERHVFDYRTGRAVLEHPAWTARPPHAARAGEGGLETPRALLAAIWQQLLFTDGPTHHRMRTTLGASLARKSARMLPFIRQGVAELRAQGELRGEIDLETDFAAPLAVGTLLHLLGWPEQRPDVAQLADWSSRLADLTTGHAMLQALPAVHQMAAAFRAMLALKQAAPADDLASSIAMSPAFASETERVVTLMVVFAAGTSTTISALVNGLPLLLADPARLAILRAEMAAGRVSLTRLVEEVVRRVTPTRCVRRWAAAEVVLGEECLDPGCPIQLELASMNRDPGAFSDPDDLDWTRLRRPEQAAFGFGPHACPGAPLARLELRLALEALLSIPGLRLVAQPSGWSHNQNQRRAQGVRVAFQEGVHR
jgi:cytochrome P450